MSCAVFSSNGVHLAISDGSQVVTVWDGDSTGKQICRVSKPDWATVKTLSWSPVKTNRKRKKKSTSGEAGGVSPVLAVGGTHGVSLWDVQRNEELYATSMEELNCVSSIAWSSSDTVYFCDGSPHVVKWNTATSDQDRLKCDKKSVCCLCVNSDGTILVTAGRTIKTWNTSDNLLIKRFSGHVSSIIDMTFLSPSMISTVADNDRSVCVWDITSKESGSLVCESSAKNVTSSLNGNQIQVCVVCVDGVHMFLMDSEDCSKHTSPTSTIQLKSKSSSQLLPILSGVMKTTTGDILLAHTSHIKPCFETISFNQENSRVCLEREVPNGLLLPNHGKSVSSSKQSHPPVISSGAAALPWGNELTVKEEDTLENVPLGDRLKALDINTKLEDTEHKRVRPTAESLSVLVVQAVHSGDKALLEDALGANDKVVRATIKNLPVTAVVPLLKTLIDLLQTRPSRGPVLSFWIKQIVLLHTAYLLTAPHLPTSLSTVYQSIESRSAKCSKLGKLKGRLDLILSAQSSSIGDGNGLTQQLDLMNTALLSVNAGSDADVENGSGNENGEYEFQSDEEEIDDDNVEDESMDEDDGDGVDSENGYSDDGDEDDMEND